MSSEHSLMFVNISVSLHNVILNNGCVWRLLPNSWNFASAPHTAAAHSPGPTSSLCLH